MAKKAKLSNNMPVFFNRGDVIIGTADEIQKYKRENLKAVFVVVLKYVFIILFIAVSLVWSILVNEKTRHNSSLQYFLYNHKQTITGALCLIGVVTAYFDAKRVNGKMLTSVFSIIALLVLPFYAISMIYTNSLSSITAAVLFGLFFGYVMNVSEFMNKIDKLYADNQRLEEYNESLQAELKKLKEKG